MDAAGRRSVERVVKVVATVLAIEDRAHTIDASTALFGSLPELDSMAIVELVSALEMEFGVRVGDDEITAEVFDTVGSLAAFVDAKIG